jgi:hypothetical protein
VTESQNNEIERVLLVVSDARERARRAADRLARDEAEAHLVSALRHAQSDLDQIHRKLMQGTFYAVPEPTEQLAL